MSFLYANERKKIPKSQIVIEYSLKLILRIARWRKCNSAEPQYGSINEA